MVVFLLLCGQTALAQINVEPEEGDDAAFVAFVNVAVVSMQDQALLEEQTVVIQGQRILSIGSLDTVSVPAGATVIDGSGRYLIPGLVDMHVHVRAPFADGPLYLNAGVTTVLSLGTSASADSDALAWQKILDQREHSRTAAFMGPTLYTTGRKVFGGETPEEVERIVRENVEGGFDIVKITGNVSPEAFDRLHDTAKQLGIGVMGHAQYSRGMQPVYTHQQDLAHLDEYLDAEFNPKNTGLRAALTVGPLVLVLLSLANFGWWMGALWRRLRNKGSSGLPPGFLRVRRWSCIFTGTAWLLASGLWLTVTDPLSGLFAGMTGAIVLVCVLMLLVVCVAVVLTLKTRIAWREVSHRIEKRGTLLLVVGFAWVLVLCWGYLTPRSWRSTPAALVRIAQDTAAAGIWVNPTLVVNDYFERVTHDEFYEVIQRPEMRFLRPEMRNAWINQNPLRQHPDALGPLQLGIKKNYNDLLFRLLKIGRASCRERV